MLFFAGLMSPDRIPSVKVLVFSFYLIISPASTHIAATWSGRSCSFIRILRRENQLHLFRRLEQSSSKQIKCDGAIEFLRLCQNLDLMPIFTKVDQTQSKNWQQSSQAFTTNVIVIELR